MIRYSHARHEATCTGCSATASQKYMQTEEGRRWLMEHLPHASDSDTVSATAPLFIDDNGVVSYLNTPTPMGVRMAAIEGRAVATDARVEALAERVSALARRAEVPTPPPAGWRAERIDVLDICLRALSEQRIPWQRMQRQMDLVRRAFDALEGRE